MVTSNRAFLSKLKVTHIGLIDCLTAWTYEMSFLVLKIFH